MRSSFRAELLVPTHGNDGRPFSSSAFERLERYLVRHFGGFTLRGEVEGCWRSPEGITMRDRSRSYVVTLSERDAEGRAAQIDAYVRRQFNQLATYLELTRTRATEF